MRRKVETGARNITFKIWLRREKSCVWLFSCFSWLAVRRNVSFRGLFVFFFVVVSPACRKTPLWRKNDILDRWPLDPVCTGSWPIFRAGKVIAIYPHAMRQPETIFATITHHAIVFWLCSCGHCVSCFCLSQRQKNTCTICFGMCFAQAFAIFTLQSIFFAFIYKKELHMSTASVPNSKIMETVISPYQSFLLLFGAQTQKVQATLNILPVNESSPGLHGNTQAGTNTLMFQAQRHAVRAGWSLSFLLLHSWLHMHG